jgi:hypothetical protein
LNKLVSIIFLIIISGQLRAQNSAPQITFGAGGGIATPFSGTLLQKNTEAFYGDAAYYPWSFFNVNFEVQAGTLSGASSGKRNLKSFTNNFNAEIINGELNLGVIIKPDINVFFDVIRNIYGGAGYGIINGDITNVNIFKPSIIDHIKNTIHIVPIKLGYELTIVRNIYDEPLLRLNGCLNLNYVKGKGLDGYYDKNAAPHSFYTYASLGLRYAISLRHGKARDYNKFD